MGDDYSSRGTIIAPDLQAHMKAEQVHSYVETVPEIYARPTGYFSCLECRWRESLENLADLERWRTEAVQGQWRQKYIDEYDERIAEERERLAILDAAVDPRNKVH